MEKNNNFYFYFKDFLNRNKILNLLKEEKVLLEEDEVITNCKIESLVFSFNTIKENNTKFGNDILIEQENTIINVVKVLKNIKNFTYFKDRIDIYQLPNVLKFISKFILTSKELIIIKNLDTEEEYLITETTIINCHKYL
jgi:hypothetical protein